MKKLMIAAAAAAMIGGVQAGTGDELIYQANFNLKTTVGTDAVTTETYNLGKDSGNSFWYQDAKMAVYFDQSTVPVTILDTTNFTYKTIKGMVVPTLTKVGQANYTVLTNLVSITDTYNKKSAGVWCLTFKVKDYVCYRVAGTIKGSGYFAADECLMASGFTPEIMDAFGGATLAKSSKVELYAEASDVVMNLVDKNDEPVEILDNKKGARIINTLYIAGHGSTGKVYDKDDGTRTGTTSVSGYAVGTADMPVCVNCCGPDVPVTPWDCCNINSGFTAVYGTFSVKYNASLTKLAYANLIP